MTQAKSSIRMVVTVGLLLVAAAARAQQAPPVQHTHVAGNVWRVDGAVDVILLQTGPDGLLMIDTGYPFAEEGVRGAMRAIAGADRVARLVNTHAHHAFANHLYADGAEIVAHVGAQRRLAGGYPMAGRAVPPAPAAAWPTVTFDDSLRLSMNGEEITLLHLPAAHTDSDVAVRFHSSNVVATGDVFVPHMPWISIDEGGSVDGLLAGLDRLLALMDGDTKVIPGHDPVTATRADVQAFRDMVASAADTVRSRMEAGLSLRAIQTLGLPHLASWRGDAVPESLFIESLYRSLARARRNDLAPTLELVDGRWWDGSGFVPRTMYAVDGVLSIERPEHVDRTIDLEGGWVIPPFGDAHTHRLTDPATLAEDARAFLGAGVFYAMVQDAIGDAGPLRSALRGRPDLPEATFAQGVVTPSWGVITDFYRRMAASGRFGEGMPFERIEGDYLFVVDDTAALAGAWPALRQRNPRFIKAILAFSDELERRRADPETYGAEPGGYSAKPGLTPEVMEELVRRAHANGLLVSAHIENAADFRLAVESGADWVAHMPASWQIGAGTGYGADELEPWLLTPRDAQMARFGTIVATTLAPWGSEDPRADMFRRVHRQNLRTLVDAGVTLAIGSDLFEGSAVDEALYLRTLGVLSDAQLLMLLVQTPRLIFPELRVGHLRPGWEASFLVLGGDPTGDLSRIRDIRLAVKRGMVLETVPASETRRGGRP